MSAITDIVTALNTQIQTLLPTYARIPNPYAIDRNSALLLRSGYGIGIGPGTNTNRIIPNSVSTDRTFDIVLLSQIEALPNDVTNIDLEEKEILEAQYSLIQYFEANPTLGSLQNVINSRYISDSGIEFVSVEEQRFHQLTLTVGVEYLETI